MRAIAVLIGVCVPWLLCGCSSTNSQTAEAVGPGCEVSSSESPVGAPVVIERCPGQAARVLDVD